MKFFLILTLVFGMGCKVTKEEKVPDAQQTIEISASDVEGVILNQRWLFQSGRVRKSNQNGQEVFRIQLFNEFYQDPCKDGQIRGRYLDFLVPALEGYVQKGKDSGRTIIFQSRLADGQSSEFKTKNFHVIIDDINGTDVEARLLAYYDESNKVNGAFDVPICP